MSEKKRTLLEQLTPMIEYFDETHQDHDKEDVEDYVEDLMVTIEATIKLEAGLITESELEEIHVNLEQKINSRFHVGGAF